MHGFSGRPAVLPAFFFIFLFFSLCEASEFVVSPVRLQINSGKDTTTLRLTNNSEKRILFQVDTFLWTQDNGDDKLAATKDIMVMPPIFTLEPGKTQLIRIALRTARSQRQELTYRIFITEVPNMTERVVEGIRTNLRISVPVFVMPKVRAKPELEWLMKRISETDLRLMLKNTGNAHILLGNLKLFSGKEGENPFYEKTLSGYVLAGQTRSWSLHITGPISSSDIYLKADTDDGKKESQLSVQSP